MLKDEDNPLRSCKSKKYIAKIMFLASIARPRFDAEGNELFSGKIGIFPFVTQESAKRTSVNRARMHARDEANNFGKQRYYKVIFN